MTQVWRGDGMRQVQEMAAHSFLLAWNTERVLEGLRAEQRELAQKMRAESERQRGYLMLVAELRFGVPEMRHVLEATLTTYPSEDERSGHLNGDTRWAQQWDTFMKWEPKLPTYGGGFLTTDERDESRPMDGEER